MHYVGHYTIYFKMHGPYNINFSETFVETFIIPRRVQRVILDAYR
jgi:hypothetical protein